MKLAVVLHLFNFELLEELHRYLSNLTYRYDLYVAVPSGSDLGQLRSYWPQAITTIHENRGFDIASFFTLCTLVLASGKKYDYLLKLHSKSDSKWRRELLEPLLGSSTQAKQALAAFKDPQVGMVGAKHWCFDMGEHWGIYHHHITEICRSWQVPLRACRFVGGTTFWVRWSLLEGVLRRVDLSRVIASTNDDNTLDWSWYLLHYADLRVAGIDTEAKALQHWLTHGRGEGRACNVLYGRKHNIPIWIDGMVEHAYERFFGLLVTHGGQRVIGL
jgi:lipopolysaccharide biosynthesis protein